ncbi:ABC-2 type transporter-domain-containing protein [Syncephalis pseudoplumigaleata]|uniref:ABC-2 type transporter-domain-containing protein n=1 Tax=Syncephalis pseudoplumigaleata TaxID=1712513 RepID=A0A4P9Z3T7_9FUNG|nr:ABC-2 type transporter-domain-containing protein [Syncephalis pseudoplumigaleata]|eukprot:RKP27214.1 ABC-2 type transporter-domain-containing protein [Syncephalis pseudoplumigaleata]
MASPGEGPSQPGRPPRLRRSSVSFGEPSTIDREGALEHYAELSRSFSRSSEATQPSRVEEGEAPEKVDLEEYLNNRVHVARHLGIRGKRLGVTFRDLVVIGDSAARAHIQTAWSPLYHALRSVATLLRIVPKPPPPEPVEILHGITGLCAYGEMLLVLGKPGSGCSTLLRVLANQRRTYKEIRGSVTYGGIPAKEMERYKGEIAYNQEDDVHYPKLTVKNTLKFACKCRTPESRITTSSHEFVRSMVDKVCEIFGLTHCMDTQVGNEMIRGVSGGERKRLSIAEQAVTMATVGIWDGSTKGLDASTALDFVRSLRIAADTLQRTTIGTFYQASESIYEQFDKVLVLDQGYCLYFGPTSRAKAYFEELGFECPKRMTTPDFLTSVTQPRERRIRRGYEDKVPETPEEFAHRFRNSSSYTLILNELAEFSENLERERPDIEFREAVLQAKHKGVRHHSPYMTPYRHQFMACFIREFHLMYGNRDDIIAHLVFNAVMAVIVGSLFYKLPPDSSGAFTRGGALFVSVLFNALSSQAELSKSIYGRGVLYKHKSYALYHPSAFYIAQVVADIPRLFISVIMYAVLIYWMTEFYSSAAAFFIFVFGLFVVSMTMTALFRLIGIVSPNIQVANIVSGIFLLSFLVYTGYIIPLSSMKGWFIWIRYINPLAWGFEALLINEYKGLVFRCGGEALIPFGPGYDDLRYKACTIPGAAQGSDRVSGPRYLSTYLDAHVAMLWPNLAITIGFWLLFIALTMFFIEVLEFGKGGYTTNVYKSNTAPCPAIHPTAADDNDDASSRSSSSDAGEQDKGKQPEKAYAQEAQEDEIPIFFWNKINYVVPVKTDPGGKRRLLANVSGWVRAGELVALMGSSGAGKTTLLDVLAQRKAEGSVSGDIRLRKHVPSTDFRLLTGYCEQMDVHNRYATVLETLYFSANLRRPASVSQAEKTADIQNIIRLLELENIAHAMIGHPETGEGISVEERKRVTIAMELVAKPTILFLDEPTSGLDAQASFTIVSLIRRLANTGQAIVCTIHQPSAILFEHFDKLLLLARGGKTVYFGDIGKDSHTLVSYFERNGASRCPPTANPAEYILDVVGAGVSATVATDWPTVWLESPEARAMQEACDRYTAACKRADAEEEAEHARHGRRRKSPPAYYTSNWVQCRIVTERMLFNYWRMPDYNFGRMIYQVIIALILGFTFYRLDYSQTDLMNRSFAVFQTTVLGVLIINDVMPQFFQQRALFIRESAAGYYSWWVFTTAMLIAEIPFLIVIATLFFVINYYLTNYNPKGSRAIYYWIMYVIFILFAGTLGQGIAAMTPNLQVAMLLAPFFSSMMAIFSGVIIPNSDMVTFWRRWMYWIDPYHYVIEGLLTNDLHDKPIHCYGNQFLTLQPPSGRTCGDYMANFFSAGNKGYIENPAAVANCRYCQYKIGDEFYATYDWSFAHRWRNFCIIIGFIVANVVIVYATMFRFRTKKQKYQWHCLLAKHRLTIYRSCCTRTIGSPRRRRRLSPGRKPTRRPSRPRRPVPSGRCPMPTCTRSASSFRSHAIAAIEHAHRTLSIIYILAVILAKVRG